MKKIGMALLCALLAFSLAFSAMASTFTHTDKQTRKYEMDEDDEFIFTSKDFNDSNIAQTIYVYLTEMYFWNDDGSYVESIEVDDGVIDFDLIIPKEAYAPMPKNAYYLSLIGNICDWMSGDDLFDKWHMLAFYINGTETVVYLTNEDFEDVGGWMTVDTGEIERQLN